MTLDPYFHDGYLNASAILEGGQAKTFVYDSDEGRVTHRFILRPIAQDVVRDELFDLTTPYGYGGPLVELESNQSSTRLIAGFERAFNSYVNDHGVVAEFIRFHPLERNWPPFTSMYQTERLRSTVITHLTPGEDPLGLFSKGARKTIRRAERAGVTTVVRLAPSDIDDFRRLYSQTMDRNLASDFYYFGARYFETLIAGMREQLLLVEARAQDRVIGSALCLLGNERIHIHLSGSDNDFLRLSPAYAIRSTIASWGAANGYRDVHHGGGRSGDPTDTLLQFKRQFGSPDGEFVIGRRVWNRQLYKKLSDATNLNDGDYFPVYRQRMKLDDAAD